MSNVVSGTHFHSAKRDYFSRIFDYVDISGKYGLSILRTVDFITDLKAHFALIIIMNTLFLSGPQLSGICRRLMSNHRHTRSGK